ncbi:hypothetical protein Gorai_009191, partial [Gossypium raimondii]|nr:hypothetical protein [Gossypium raimondii]
MMAEARGPIILFRCNKKCLRQVFQ